MIAFGGYEPARDQIAQGDSWPSIQKLGNLEQFASSPFDQLRHRLAGIVQRFHRLRGSGSQDPKRRCRGHEGHPCRHRVGSMQPVDECPRDEGMFMKEHAECS